MLSGPSTFFIPMTSSLPPDRFPMLPRCRTIRQAAASDSTAVKSRQKEARTLARPQDRVKTASFFGESGTGGLPVTLIPALRKAAQDRWRRTISGWAAEAAARRCEESWPRTWCGEWERGRPAADRAAIRIILAVGPHRCPSLRTYSWAWARESVPAEEAIRY